MIVKTKKYKLPVKTYIRLGLKNVLKQQWWTILIAVAIASVTFIVPSNWFWISALILYTLYLLFWVIQFAGIPQLPQNKVLFERLGYEIDPRQILIKVSSKQGMPITWNMIKRAEKNKNHFLLVVTKAQMIHLPFRIFNSPNDIKLTETLLKRKKLLK